MSGANVSPIGRNKEEWLVHATDYRKLNEPPRPRLSKEREHLLDGASTPPLPRRGIRLLVEHSQPPVFQNRLMGHDQVAKRGNGLSRLLKILLFQSGQFSESRRRLSCMYTLTRFLLT